MSGRPESLFGVNRTIHSWVTAKKQFWHFQGQKYNNATERPSRNILHLEVNWTIVHNGHTHMEKTSDTPIYHNQKQYPPAGCNRGNDLQDVTCKLCLLCMLNGWQFCQCGAGVAELHQHQCHISDYQRTLWNLPSWWAPNDFRFSSVQLQPIGARPSGHVSQAFRHTIEQLCGRWRPTRTIDQGNMFPQVMAFNDLEMWYVTYVYCVCMFPVRSCPTSNDTHLPVESRIHIAHYVQPWCPEWD